MSKDISKVVAEYLESFSDMKSKIDAINQLKTLIHRHSPFRDEPVDCVLWVDAESVTANDYNPNSMSATEKNCWNARLKWMVSPSRWWPLASRNSIWLSMAFIAI